MDPASGPTELDLLHHKQANARVVRLEDALVEALGHGWATAPPSDTSAVANLYTELRKAIAERAETQLRLFPGLAGPELPV